jgi:hypothetical protein
MQFRQQSVMSLKTELFTEALFAGYVPGTSAGTTPPPEKIVCPPQLELAGKPQGAMSRD